MSVILAVLLWIVIGAIAGWIASSLMGVHEGFWGNVLIGIVGAIIGGVIFSLLKIGGSGFWWNLLAAVVGAVILLAIVRAFRRPAATTSM